MADHSVWMSHAWAGLIVFVVFACVVMDGFELGVGLLLAAFPLACAVLMPALYPLVIAMLLGLIFRGKIAPAHGYR